MGFEVYLMVEVTNCRPLHIIPGSLDSAPGMKFGVTGNQVAISFGNWTSPDVLVGFRFDGVDW